MAMKLDTALKVYIVLYVVAFALTFLVSVPMLIHTTPRGECLLYVTKDFIYGPAFCEHIETIVFL